MVQVGLEPTCPQGTDFTDRRANQLLNYTKLYPRWDSNPQNLHPKCSGYTNSPTKVYCDPERDRTVTPLVKSQVLYQLSYEVIKVADMVGFEPTMWFPSQVNSLVLSASERHAKIIVVYSDNLLKFSGTPDRT